jgi:hypothetical protein
MPNLQQLVQRELARRQDEGSSYNPFRFVVKNGPKGMTNVEEAVAAIEEELEARDKNIACASPVIALSIKDDVVAALHAKHPKRFTRSGVGIIVRKIVDSSMRLAPVPVPAISEYDGPSASPVAPPAIQVPVASPGEDDATARAAARIRAMRRLN